MYNLHTEMNPETFNDMPSNICGFTTLVAPYLPSLATAPSASKACICICIAANCSCYCLMIVWKLS